MKSMPQRSIFKKCRHGKGKFTPQARLFTLEIPGIDIANKIRDGLYFILNDGSLFYLGHGELEYRKIFILLVPIDIVFVQWSLNYRSVFEIITDSTDGFQPFLRFSIIVYGN